MAMLFFLFGAVVLSPFFIYIYMVITKHKTSKDDFYVACGGFIMGASFFAMVLSDVDKLDHPLFVLCLGLLGSVLATFNTLRMLRSIRSEHAAQHKA